MNAQLFPHVVLHYWPLMSSKHIAWIPYPFIEKRNIISEMQD